MDGARFANAVVSTGASPGGPDLARGGRRPVVRLRQEWRAERRGADPVRTGACRRGRWCGASAPGICCRRAACSPRRSWRMLEDDLWLDNARAANAAAQTLAEAAGERLVYPVEANEIFVRVTRRGSGGAARAGLRLLRLGRRAKSGWSPAGTRTASPWSGSPRRSPRCEREALGPSREVIASLHHLHRDLGIDLDRHPRPARHRAAAMVGHLPLRHRRRRRWRWSRSGRARACRLDRGGIDRRRLPRRSPSSASISTRSISPSSTSPRAWSRRCSRCC